MPDPRHNSTPATGAGLEYVPAAELKVGDCPVSLAGWRPIRKIKIRKRARTVLIWTDGQKREVQADALILTRRHRAQP